MKALVAEDDATSLKILQAILARWGFQVLTASDGNEALAAFSCPDPPRIALLDWMMPGMDGVEVCRRVKALQTDAPPYIVMLTAREAKEDLAAALEAGADDYVTKPFDARELRARLAVGRRVVELQEALAQKVRDLQDALEHVKTLQGILPICMHCHRIRNDQESWERLEKYITEHSDAQFSHGLCPECLEKYYPEPQEA